MRIFEDIADFIFVEDEPRASDIIFIPGGSHALLPERAAALYRDGFAPLLLPSGGYSIKHGHFCGVRDKPEVYGGDYPTECAFYTDVLRRGGVPAEAIWKEDKSEFTQQNAVFSRAVCDARGLAVRRAILVCKNFHARRALMYYQMALPETELLVAAVDVFGFDRSDWHRHALGFERVLGELARCGNQMGTALKSYAEGGAVK